MLFHSAKGSSWEDSVRKLRVQGLLWNLGWPQREPRKPQNSKEQEHSAQWEAYLSYLLSLLQRERNSWSF